MSKMHVYFRYLHFCVIPAVQFIIIFLFCTQLYFEKLLGWPKELCFNVAFFKDMQNYLGCRAILQSSRKPTEPLRETLRETDVGAERFSCVFANTLRMHCRRFWCELGVMGKSFWAA